MSTVTRRRVAGQGSNSDDDTMNSPNPDSTQHNPLAEKKVAYDPRDIDESKSTPKLTLMEEVLLLGLKDKQVFVLNIIIYFEHVFLFTYSILGISFILE